MKEGKTPIIDKEKPKFDEELSRNVRNIDSNEEDLQEIVSKIGEGSTSEVFKVENQQFERKKQKMSKKKDSNSSSSSSSSD